MQSASTLMRSHGDDGGMGRSALLGALESLRGLSESRLESVCADEAAAHEAVKSHLSGLESCVGAEVVSTCMALFTLGCRNGLSVCGTVDMVEVNTGMYIKWLEAASGVDAVDCAAGAHGPGGTVLGAGGGDGADRWRGWFGCAGAARARENLALILLFRAQVRQFRADGVEFFEDGEVWKENSEQRLKPSKLGQDRGYAKVST